MKKTVTVLLIAALVASLMMLASCGGDPVTTDGTTSGAEVSGTPESSDTAAAVIEVPDVTMKYVPADIYVNAEAVEASGYKAADNTNISKWFKDVVEFDDNFNIKIPDEFGMLDGYVLRIAQGQYIMEVDVFKVADTANVDAVKALAEYRCNKQKNNGDFKLYDDDEGTNAKMIDTGKVVAIGNYVVYAVTDNTDVSILRAQKYVSEHPGCTALELYHAIVIEEN